MAVDQRSRRQSKRGAKSTSSNRFSINLVSTKIKTPLEAFLKGFSEVPSGIGTRKGLERIDTYLIDLQRYVKI